MPVCLFCNDVAHLFCYLCSVSVLLLQYWFVIVDVSQQCCEHFRKFEQVELVKTCLSSTYQFFITKTCLYNVDPLKPHFYIVKLWFTRVYIIFLISAQNIDCGYALEPPRRGSSNEYPQSYVMSRNLKNIRIFIWIFFFYFFGGKIFSIFEKACYRNV